MEHILYPIMQLLCVAGGAISIYSAIMRFKTKRYFLFACDVMWGVFFILSLIRDIFFW